MAHGALQRVELNHIPEMLLMEALYGKVLLHILAIKAR